jgi:hypothetical protein
MASVVLATVVDWGFTRVIGRPMPFWSARRQQRQKAHRD